jgi:hypothetical protein
MKVLVVAAFDSEIKIGSNIAKIFVARGAIAHLRIPQVTLRQQAVISNGNLELFDDVKYCNQSSSLILNEIEAYKVIIIVVNGSLTGELSLRIADLVPSSIRPYVITSFNGLCIFNSSFGFQMRLNSDLFLINSKKDYERCLKIAKYYCISASSLFVSGLPGTNFVINKCEPPENVERIIFADQPDVPSRVQERVYILDRLIEYATVHPDRRVLLKPRNRVGMRSFNRTIFHYELLLRSFYKQGSLPQNFSITYRNLEELYDEGTVLLTVSSTAAIDALQNNIYSSVIADFGFSEKYGNEYFLGSNLSRSFDEIIEDKFVAICPSWKSENLDAETLGSVDDIYEIYKSWERSGGIKELPSYRNVRYQLVLRNGVKLKAIKERLMKNWIGVLKFIVLIIASKMRR